MAYLVFDQRYDNLSLRPGYPQRVLNIPTITTGYNQQIKFDSMINVELSLGIGSDYILVMYLALIESNQTSRQVITELFVRKVNTHVVTVPLSFTINFPINLNWVHLVSSGSHNYYIEMNVGEAGNLSNVKVGYRSLI
ncbi:hypothetical protein [Brevibacillus sp. DP1.3A]|uniref:hypothetical protein n=1 Tax=Brevibacillus sp. DP1.3A TaxID=2738867 RepID=UPI00156B85A3|nr:hypothetical protein [Brevibacillus sp. DP1.3A]UED72237.1 hypothetical protein HP399_015840 [Brevibacillus sp. DP1.3A]